MTKCATDPGRADNYTPLYSALFKERSCRSALRVLELGLGSNNLHV